MRAGRHRPDTVLEVIIRSNQRGGRMLSILDLIDVGTLSVPQSAWLIDRLLDGSSWLVGAKPGGAGKTTIMGALLGMLPAGTTVWVADRGGEWRQARLGDCVVAYEVSPGSHDAYVWGSELRELVELGSQQCRIVSNLHADTIAEARDQIVGQNGVPEDSFARFDLFLPISVGGWGSPPRIEMIIAFADGEWGEVNVGNASGQAADIAAWLEMESAGEERRIEAVRGEWLGWLAGKECEK